MITTREADKSVCMSVFLSVYMITLEILHVKSSFLICGYILRRHGFKVIGSRSRSQEQKSTTFLIPAMYTVSKKWCRVCN